MFNKELWIEIFGALRRNKLRTFLTGFAIAWGIFMLIILLSVGNGLKNTVMKNFSGRDTNAYTLYAGEMSKPYKGHETNTTIQFSNKDIELLKNLPHVAELSPINSSWANANYKDKSINSELKGVFPVQSKIENALIYEGRFINDQDIKQKRKVIVIDKYLQDNLFPNEQDIIGKYIDFGGISFQIVGITNSTDFGRGFGSTFIPYTTSAMLYRIDKFYELNFTTEGIENEEQDKAFLEKLRYTLAQLHEFDPEDERAVYIQSSLMTAKETKMIFNSISIFIWIIGIAMLISGIVGISNIMLITVKERTNEIGIRKALGAKPWSILKSIILESLLITVIFGYIGMMIGIGITEIINKIITQAQSSGSEFAIGSLSINIGIVLAATAVLIFSGVLAGFFPARKAVRVKPIEAIQYR